MLRIELSALSAQELKRLLDQARARSQSTLEQQLLAELEARPSNAEAWRSPPRPMSWTPTYDDFLEAEPATAPPRRGGVMAVTATIAALVSAAVTWGISVPPERPEPLKTDVGPHGVVLLASVAPVGPRQIMPASVDTASQPPPVKRLAATSRAGERNNPCYNLATAAERLVCGYPSLADRDRQMRRALDRARATGGDLRALEAEQAGFRSASEDVSDRRVLADLYDRRIRELEDATARARDLEPLF
ncbi:MAG: hypothetical protein U1C74_05520 [Phenylobacterium sp.]|nr:hypothetical protein [Phenylobacterium sp.]